MTDDRLAEIRERERAASAGPWVLEHDTLFVSNPAEVVANFDWSIQTEEERAQLVADGEFAAHARSDVPGLLAEVERLREKDRKNLLWEARLAGGLLTATDNSHDLGAEIDRLRAHLDAAQRMNIRIAVLARALLSTPDAILEHLDQLPEDEKAGALIVADGQVNADDLLAAGWTISDRVDYVAGKRLRFLIPPIAQQQDSGAS